MPELILRLKRAKPIQLYDLASGGFKVLYKAVYALGRDAAKLEILLENPPPRVKLVIGDECGPS